MPRRRPASPVRSVTTAAALVAVLALSACSADELDVDGFSPGTCADLADTLQEVDGTLQQVGDDDLGLEEAGDRFEAAQGVLKQASGSAEAPLAGSITELVTRLGFFRVSVDSGSHGDEQDADVRTALDALAEDCRS